VSLSFGGESSITGGIMKPLPVEYRVVGGLSIAYAVFTGGMMAYVLYHGSPGSNSPGSLAKPTGVLDWLLPGAYVCKCVALFLAGCLLFARQAKGHRAAQLALIAAALGCLLEAVLLIVGTYLIVTMAFTSDATQGPLAIFIIFITGPLFGLAALWTVVTLITAVKLGRYLKRVERVTQYRERFNSLPTEALTATLESGALNAEAGDAVVQILRDRRQSPGHVDTRFQAEPDAADRPRE
jgi:hypothetical protein